MNPFNGAGGKKQRSRRQWYWLRLAMAVVLGFTLTWTVASCTPKVNAPAASANAIVRIGYQPNGTLPLLRDRGTLEQRLDPLGVSVEWQEFSAGPAIMQAMGKNQVDIGQTGGVPPLFAQAEDISFVYIANEEPGPEKIAILVPKNSTLKTLSDLKGKKIAFTKASSAHYFLAQALTKARLDFSDVEIVFLPPPDAREVFAKGEVDAWIIWDPFQALAVEELQAQVLATGEGLTLDMNFYFASLAFLKQHADLIPPIVEELRQTGMWARQNPDAAAKILAAQLGLGQQTTLTIHQRATYNAQLLQDRAVKEQQRMADTFFRLGLLAKPIEIEDRVWKAKL
jgi:sulfonate transport system substrate-binding protein